MSKHEAGDLRSPLKRPPMRQAGTSGFLRFLENEFSRFMGYLAVFAVGIGSAAGAWLTYFKPGLWWPSVWTAFALTAFGLLLVQYKRTAASADIAALGVRGEKAVAEALKELEPHGYRAFHDLPSREYVDKNGESKANIDHVLIGPAGVFVIETKTRNKRDGHRGKAVVKYDGQRVQVDGGPPDDDPIAQVKTCREEVRRYIEQQTGLKDVPVRGVVVYPGWYVEERSGAEVWVLEPRKRLPVWVRKEEELLGAKGRLMKGNRLSLVGAAVERWARGS